MISADDVERAELATTQVKRGYDADEVDAFRARVVAALRAHAAHRPADAGLTADEVAHRMFTVTQFQAGYDEQEVDSLLDQVVAALRALESGEEGAPLAVTPEGAASPDDALPPESFEAQDESLGGLIVRGLRGAPPPE